MKKKSDYPIGKILKDDGKWHTHQVLDIKRSKYFNAKLELFIATCLKEVPGENNFTYLQEKLDNYKRPLDPKDPGYQAIAAIQEMIDKGVSKNAMMDLVRIAWADSMFSIFLTLEAEFIHKPTWGLYIQDSKGNPKSRVMNGEVSCSFEEPEFISRNWKKKLKSKKKSKSSISKKVLKK